MATSQSENVPFKGKDISPDKDGGLLKEIVREGVGDEKPLFDDDVTIHYVGKELDGKVFSDSRERDEKVTFSLGKGGVIPAWDLGAATMKRGEIARILAEPKYAYGVKGERKFRSATNVIFEIELLDFVGKDISEEKDGSIIRRIIRRGEGKETPNEDATVEIHLKSSNQDKVFDERTVQFVVGLGFLQNIPQRVEQVVCRMLRNEHCRLVLKSSTPTEATVQHEITLIKFQRLEEKRLLTEREKLEQSELLKARADDLVKNGHYEHAVKRYLIIVDLLATATYREKADNIKCRQMRVAAHSNLALCYLKLGQHLQCKNACNDTLALDPRNEKCLFRRGQAQFAFSNFEPAIKDFQAVLKINPSNVAAEQQIELCHQRQKEHEMKQKETYKTFFSDASRPSLFEVDDKYEEAKQTMKNANPLRSMGLEPVNLDFLRSRDPNKK